MVMMVPSSFVAMVSWWIYNLEEKKKRPIREEGEQLHFK